jgi:hypothetical protein
MPHQSEHRRFRGAIFRQARGEGVTKIVQTTVDPGIGPQLIPSPRDIGGVPCRVAWPRLPPGKEMVVRGRFAEFFHIPGAVSGQNHPELVVDRDHPAGAV